MDPVGQWKEISEMLVQMFENAFQMAVSMLRALA
jgi:hypothetical protein